MINKKINVRAQNMWLLYRDKRKTLTQIGIIYGISHERVRQLLKLHTDYKNIRSRKYNYSDNRERVPQLCINCKKIIKYRKYCSDECWKEFVVKRHSLPKKCRRCGIVKHADEFYPTYYKPGFRRSYCKKCYCEIKKQ